MKHTYLFLAVLSLISTGAIAQTNIFPTTGSAGVGTVTPASSALLEVQSTSKGFLAPRMTKAQRDAIVAPVTGLLIFQTNSTPGFYYYNGASWTAISTKGANTSLSNLAATTSINQHLQPNANNTLDLGSSANHWNELYVQSVKFMDGTTQTTAGGGMIYTAGSGISIAGTEISNSAPDQIVALTGAGATSVTGTYPNFTITSINTDPTVGSTIVHKIPKWNGAALVDGSITDDGIHVGIGTATPTATFEVSGGDAIINGLAIGKGPGIGLYNTILGEQAMQLNTEGGNNSAIGYRALFANTDGYNNSANGAWALYSNTSGAYNTAHGNSALYTNTIGEKNTAIGSSALYANITGYENTAVGNEALYNNTSGYGNTAGGNFAITSNTTGYENTAYGASALYSNLTGNSSTAIGYEALYANLVGTLNTAVGHSALKNNTGDVNTATGAYALENNTSGFGNSASGTEALRNNTTGNSNTALGRRAMYTNTTGSENTAIGSLTLHENAGGNYNTAVGYESQFNNTGWLNTSVGHNTLKSNTTGELNVAIGASALFSNTVGYSNAALGTETLFNNTTGDHNTAAGWRALYTNSTGEQNTAIGALALNSNTSGWANFAGGYHALYTNTIGYYNTATGVQALYSNTSGYYNTASGFQALYSNTNASGNTAFGYKSLFLNTTGYDNAAVGEFALNSNTTGYKNTAIGGFTLYSNSEGYRNTAIGEYAMYDNTTGDYNTAVGQDALESNTIAFGNSAFGVQALQFNTTGERNAAFGIYALESNNTTSYNAAFGYLAGNAPADNGYCSYFGSEANEVVAGTYNYSTAIGYASRITASNQVRIGYASTTSIGGYVGWTNISDGRFKENVQQNVPGLEFITRLEPVTYTLNVNGLRAITGEDLSAESDGGDIIKAKPDDPLQEVIHAKSKIIYTGFIAQDVEKIAKELNYSFSGVDIPQNEHTPYGLRYAEFVVPIVQAIKELDSIDRANNAELARQSEKINELETDLEEMRLQIDKLAALFMETGLNDRTITGSNADITATTISLNGAWLEQNIPNPFSGSTVIRCFVPEGYHTAELMISTQAGNVINRAVLSQSGIHEITIDAQTVSSGAYFYALVIDGILIGKKQMILTN